MDAMLTQNVDFWNKTHITACLRKVLTQAMSRGHCGPQYKLQHTMTAESDHTYTAQAQHASSTINSTPLSLRYIDSPTACLRCRRVDITQTEGVGSHFLYCFYWFTSDIFRWKLEYVELTMWCHLKPPDAMSLLT